MFFSTAATSVAALLMICACRFDASSMCRHSSYDHARHRDFVGTLTARRSSRNQLFRVGVVRCRVKIYWRLKLPMQRGSKRQGQRQRRGGAVWYGGISWPALHTCSYTNFVPIVSQQKNVVITVSISQQVLTQLHGTVTVKATKLSTHSTGTFFCFSQKKCVFNQPSDQHRKSNELPLQKSAAMYCILAALFSWNRQLLPVTPGYCCCVPLPEHSFTFSAVSGASSPSATS